MYLIIGGRGGGGIVSQAIIWRISFVGENFRELLENRCSQRKLPDCHRNVKFENVFSRKRNLLYDIIIAVSHGVLRKSATPNSIRVGGLQLLEFVRIL